MQLALKRRMQLFNIAQPTLSFPLYQPTSGAMVLEGKVASTSIDLQRTRFMPRCFTWPSKVELRYRHEELAGDVDDLWHSSAGELFAKVTASHILARRTSHFSIAASVHHWKMINPNTSEFYAEVYSATITEVSLTPSPCAPDCKVLKREPAHAVENSHHALLAKMQSLMKAAEGLRT